ncbi:CHAT domain-containing protein [candidate division KSB1 bacterium]|nr:CHAT domain-containing protein [candidate division KSB1 bacterium]
MEHNSIIFRLRFAPIILLAGWLLLGVKEVAWSQDAESSVEKPDFYQVTTHPDIDLSPRISPDGKWMAYVVRQTYNFDIWVRGTRGGRTRQITYTQADDFYPVWSPDSKSLFYVSQTKDAAGDIWRIRLKEVKRSMFPKGEPERITDYQGFDGYPAVSGDGKKIAFVSDRSGRDEIWLYDEDTRLTGQLTFLGGTHPAWGVNKNLLAFTSFRSDPHCNGDIWLMDLTENNPASALESKNQESPEPAVWPLTYGPAADGFPSWSPDANRIVFLRFEFDTNGDGVLSPADCGELWHIKVGVPPEESMQSELLQSPFRDLLQRSFNPMMVRAATPLTSSGTNIMQPWYGGDRRVYFTSDRGGNLDIWSIPESGPIPRQENVQSQLDYVDQMYPLNARASLQSLGPLYLGFRELSFSSKERRTLWDRILALKYVIEYFPEEPAITAQTVYELGVNYAFLGFERQARDYWQTLLQRFADERRIAFYSELALLGLKVDTTPDVRMAEDFRREINSLIEKYKDQVEPASVAQIAVGDLFYLSGDHMRAFQEYAKVQKNYAKQRDACAASQLKIGDVFKEFASQQEVINAYLEVLKNYPDQRQWMVPARERILQILTEGTHSDQELISRYREIAGQYTDFGILAVEAQYRIGQLLYKIGDYREAGQEYEVIETLFPSLPVEVFNAQMGRTEALIQSGESMKAFDLLQSLVIKHKDSNKAFANQAENKLVQAYLYSADQLRGGGDLQLASVRYRAAWMIDLRNIHAHRGYLECKYYMRAIDDAIIEYRQLNTLNPGNNILQYALGLAYSYKGTEKAELDGDPDGLDPYYLVSRSGGTIARALSLDYTLVPAYLTISYNAEMMENYEARQRSKPKPFLTKVWRTLTAPIISLYHSLTFYEETKPVRYYERAIHELNKAIVLNDETVDPKLEASLALNLANNYYNLGEFGYEKAYEFYQVKLKYDSAFVDKQRQALIYERMGHCALVTEDLQKGPEFLLHAIEMYQKMDNEPRLLLNIKRLALLYEIGRQYDMAIEYYQRAIDMEARYNDYDNLLRSYRSIAYNFLNLKEPADAIEYARKAYNLLQSGKVKTVKSEASRIKVGFLGLYVPIPFIDLSNMAGGSTRSFSTEDELALIYSIFGESYVLTKDYDSAIPFFLKKIEIFHKRKDDRAEAIFYNNLGYIYFLRGDYKEAWNYFRSSLRLCEKNKIFQGIIENNLNLGRIVSSWHLQKKQGQILPLNQTEFQAYIDDAAERINIAFKTLEESEAFYSRERCQLLLQLAELTILYSQEGKSEGVLASIEASLLQIEKATLASVYLKEVLEISQRYRLSDMEAMAHYALGELNRSIADFDNGLTYLQDARRIALRNGLFEILWRIDLGLGDLHVAMNRETKHRLIIQQDASEFYFEAIDILETHPELSKDDVVPEMRQAKKLPYLRAIQYLAAKGDTLGSLIFAERMRAKAYLDLVNSEEIVLRKERHKIYFGNARFVQKKLDEINSNLLRAKNQADIPPYQVREWQRQRRDYLEEYENIIENVRAEIPELENMVRVNPVGLAQVQQQINFDEALVFFQSCDSTMLSWTITREAIKLSVLPITSRKLHDSMATMIRTLPQADSLYSKGHIFEQLMRPIKELAEEFNRIVLIPEGQMVYFPWNALILSQLKNNTFSQVSASTSLTAYYYASQKRKIQGDRIFIADNRNLAQELGNQRYRVVQPTPTAQQKVSEIQFGAMSLSDIIHLRIESEWNTIDPLQSKIGFRIPRSAPAVFNVKQLYQNNFAAGLMVLQPNTSLISIKSDEPFLAWERGLIYSGVPAMMLSLWSGSAEKEEAFYRDFYANLMEMPPGKALTATQMSRLSRNEDISEWGRFQLFGFGGMTSEEEQLYAAEGFSGKVRRGHSAFDLGEWSDAIRFYEEALQMAERQREQESIALLNQRILESAVNGALWEKAIDLQNRLLEEAENARDISGIANSYNNLAFFHTQNGQFNQGVAFKAKYSELANRYGLHQEEAKSLREMGLIYERGNQPEKALELFQQAKEKFEQIDDRTGTAQSLRDMGRIYFIYFDNYTAALKVQEQALSIFRRGPIQMDLVDAWQNLGLIHEKMGNYQLALSCQETAYDLALQLQDLKYIGLAHQYQANVLWKMGNYQAALQNQNHALEIFTELGDEKLLQVALATRGLIALSFNQFEQALAFEEQALQYALQRDDQHDQAMIHKNIGLVHRAQKKNDLALVSFEQAAMIDSTIGSKRGLAYDYRNLAALYGEENRTALAIQTASRALSMSVEINDVRNQAQSLLALAHLMQETAHVDTIAVILQKVVQLSESHFMPEITWRAQKKLAEIERDRNHIPAAIEQFYRALDTIESMRARIQVEEYAAGFIDDKLDVYGELIDLLVKENKAEEALIACERARSRSFLDMLGQRRIDFSSTRETTLMSVRDSLQVLLNQAQTELIFLRSLQDISQTRRIKELESQVESLRAEFSRHLLTMREYNPEFSDLVQPQPLQIDTIKALLPDSTGLIEYFLLHDKLIIWLVTSHSVQAVTTALTESQLDQDIFDLRHSLERQLSFDELAKRIYGYLIQPLEEKLARLNHLILIPHKKLHYLPFAVLHAGDKNYFAFNHTLSVSPSATIFGYCLKKGKIFLSKDEKQMDVLAFGNPDLGDPKLFLPFAEREVKSLQRFYPNVEYYLNQRASETQLIDSAADASLLLFSCHGMFDDANPLLSALLLSPDDANDGRLEAHEIFSLQLDAALVAMSACETGLGTIRSGDEVVGLSRSFIYAGAASLMSSLWKVDDLATAVLVKRFFRYLAEGYSRAQALQKAQKLVYEAVNPYPAYWAAFTITGDFR